MGDQPEPAVPPAAPPATPPAAKPEIVIPKPRFDEVNERMKKAEEERDALKIELQAARAEASAREPEPDPAPQDSPLPAEPQQPPEPRVDQDELQRLRIATRHRLSEDAAALVQTLIKRGNTEDDALALAKLKAPKAFAGRDLRGFDPTTHSAAPPGSGRQPPPKPEPTVREQIAATRDPHRRGKMALDAAVDHVREQMKGQFK